MSKTGKLFNLFITGILLLFTLGLSATCAYALTINKIEIMVDDDDITAGQCVTVSARITYSITIAENQNIADPAYPVNISCFYDAWGINPVRLGPVVHNLFLFNIGAGFANPHITGWIPIGMIYPFPVGGGGDGGDGGDPDYYLCADLGPGTRKVYSEQVEVENGGAAGLTPAIASLDHNPDIAGVTPAAYTAGSSGNTVLCRFDAQSIAPIGNSIVGIQQLILTVPNGWSLPQNTPGIPGYTAVSAIGGVTGMPTFSGNQVSIPIISLNPSGHINIVYGSGGGSSGVTVPGAVGDYDFGITALGPQGVQNGILRVAVQNAIPTLSQWGLIIFSLLLLAVGMVFVHRRQNALVMVGDIRFDTAQRPSVFDRSLYFRALGVVLLIAVIGLAISYWYFGELTRTDRFGTLASAGIVAYMAQLWLLMKKK